MTATVPAPAPPDVPDSILDDWWTAFANAKANDDDPGLASWARHWRSRIEEVLALRATRLMETHRPIHTAPGWPGLDECEADDQPWPCDVARPPVDVEPPLDMAALRRDVLAMQPVRRTFAYRQGFDDAVLIVLARLRAAAAPAGEPAAETLDVELREIVRLARVREAAEEVYADAETRYNESSRPEFTRRFLQIDRLANERAEAVLALRAALRVAAAPARGGSGWVRRGTLPRPPALERLERLAGEATPGPWRTWGMQLRASTCPERCADLDHSVLIADFHTVRDGQPRTFDLDYVVALRNAAAAPAGEDL